MTSKSKKARPGTNLQSRRFGISEAVALGALSLAGYAVVFQHHAGFADYFGFPRSLISLDLAAFVTSGLHLAVFAMGVMLVLIGLRYNAFLVFVWLGLPLALIVYSAVALRGFERLWGIGMGVAYVALPFLLIWAEDKKEPGAPAEDSQKTFAEGSALYRMASAFGVNRRTFALFTISVGVLGAGTSLAHAEGKRDARIHRTFLVSSGSSPMVVLRHYGGYFICAPLRRADSSVVRSFRILPVVGDSARIWNLERVGPLKVDTTSMLRVP